MFLAGKSPNIRSYTVPIYGSGQPYMCAHAQVMYAGTEADIAWHVAQLMEADPELVSYDMGESGLQRVRVSKLKSTQQVGEPR